MAAKSSFRLVIITGMSGAGKTGALRSLEDVGFFCVDNLPPNLLSKFAELLAAPGQEITNIALVMDVRGGHFFGTFFESLRYLDEKEYDYEILFLEASVETLIRRFKQTRRKHPLSEEGSILEGIMEERNRLYDVREVAGKIIDTSELTPAELKDQVQKLFVKRSSAMVISLVSFGFKYGLPLDADLVMDVRFLSNPHYEEKLNSLSGEDLEVEKFVMDFPETQRFLDKFINLLLFLFPNYLREGKSHLVVAVGCTGGKHRSVVLTRKIETALSDEGYNISVKHRDISKD